MTWKIDVRLYSSVRGQLPNVVLTNMCLSCWFYLWGSDVICAFILIIICCEISGLWVGSHTTCVSAECAYVLWHVLIMKRFTSDVFQHLFATMMPFCGCRVKDLAFYLIVYFPEIPALCNARTCAPTHTHTQTVTFYSADADSSWLTQVDLFPYPAAPVSPCSGSFNALCTT